MRLGLETGTLVSAPTQQAGFAEFTINAPTEMIYWPQLFVAKGLEMKCTILVIFVKLRTFVQNVVRLFFFPGISDT